MVPTKRNHSVWPKSTGGWFAGPGLLPAGGPAVRCRGNARATERDPRGRLAEARISPPRRGQRRGDVGPDPHRRRGLVLPRPDARLRDAGAGLERDLADRAHRHRRGGDPAGARPAADVTLEDRLTLADWRRRVAALYAEVRRLAADDPAAAHEHWR